MRSRATDRDINPYNLPDCTVSGCAAKAHTVSHNMVQHYTANDTALPPTPADQWQADMLRARTQDVADYTNQTGNLWPAPAMSTSRRTAP